MAAKRPGDEDEETIVMAGGERTLPASTVPIAVGVDFNSGEFRTRYAAQAISLAERFNLIVGALPLKGAVRFRAELSAPDGQSTGGGEQSVQHIKLIPADGGATLVAGWCNTVARAAEVRSLAFLDREHERRFHGSTLAAPPPPSQRLGIARYEELILRMRDFCVEQDYKLTIADPPEGQPTQLRAAPVAPKPRRGGRVWPLVLLLVAILAMACVMVVRRGRLLHRARSIGHAPDERGERLDRVERGVIEHLLEEPA